MTDQDNSVASINYLLSAILSYRKGEWTQDEFFKWVDALEGKMIDLYYQEKQ